MIEIRPDSDVTLDLLSRVNEAEGRAAFDRLFDRHRAFLRRVIELRLDASLRARLDPSDIVQEAQLEAFRRFADFLARRPMPFRLWLRKTAWERLLMARRKHIGASRRSVDREWKLPDHSSVQLARQLLAADPSPSQQVRQDELANRVRKAMAQLSEIDHEILLMRNFEGLSYKEIAEILEIDPAAARKRHGRALLRLHRLLIEGGLTESEAL